MAAARPAMERRSALRTTGTTRPFSVSTAMPMWMACFSTMASSTTEALRAGVSRRARTTAWTMKGRKVSATPWLSWKLPLLRARSFTTSLMSASATVPTWGLVRFEYTM